MQEKIAKIEEDFDTLMSILGLHGDCHLDYQEKHPVGMNFSGKVTCRSNIDTHRYTWQLDYLPASMTTEGFIRAIKARLFDMLCSLSEEEEETENE